MFLDSNTGMYNIVEGDALTKLKEIKDQTIQCCITSPPYFSLRDYQVEGQIGLEKTYPEYLTKLVEVFREVHRVLKDDGTCWIVIGDSYAGSWGNQSRKENQGKQRPITKEQIQNFKPYGNLENATKTGSRERTPGLKPKDLMGIPWRLAFALQEDGWWLRQDIIWSKVNCMPHPITDRCVSSHEYIFLLSKSQRYFFDHIAIREPAVSKKGSGNNFKRKDRLSFMDKEGPRGNDKKWDNVGGLRNKRSVWTIKNSPFHGGHVATFPLALIEPMILAGTKADDLILDPFSGAGTVGVGCKIHSRNFLGIELNPAYCEMARDRINKNG